MHYTFAGSCSYGLFLPSTAAAACRTSHALLAHPDGFVQSVLAKLPELHDSDEHVRPHLDVG